MSKNIKVYEIEKDIPIPDEASALPLSDLDIGESILVPATERNRAATLASKLKARKGLVFTVRLVDNSNIRVWRTK